MEQCESKSGGICTRAATWKQRVHAGNREDGRFQYHSYWCDEHAERIAEKRRVDWIAPAKMVRISQQVVP